MTASIKPEVQAIIDRCAAIDWRRPPLDPVRVAAAYERRLAATGLERRVRWIADPAEADDWDLNVARTTKAWSVWASLAGASGRRRTALDDVGGGMATDHLAAWPQGWDTLADLRNVWDPGGAATAARTAWEARAAWPARVAESASVDWDSGTGCAAVCAQMMAAWADMVANDPMLAWTAGPPINPVIASSGPIRPLVAWAFIAGHCVRTAWTTWHSTAAQDAGLALGCLNLPTRDDVVDELIATYEPMIEAYEGGALAHTLLDREIMVLASPSIWTDGRRLHRADGPALAWPRTKVYAWKGVIVPERLIMRPHEITPDMILAENNQERRRTMIEIYGYGRYMQDVGGVMVHEDHTGRLWRLQPRRHRVLDRAEAEPSMLRRQPDDLAVVEVANGTVDPDGSRKTYWLCVPPHMQTAKQAVAWSYGMTPDQYDGLVVRT